MAGQTLGTAYVQIVPSAQGIKGSITNAISPEAEAAGTSAGTKIGSFAKKALLAVGIGAAVVKVMKASLDEGAKLQQSYYGGLDTLYGDAADSARELAKQASTAGISMSDYSEQAVSFGAALKKAYGGDTKKAVEAANTAILDMADNSAKMGTPLESIQQAYQGFAKGQYTLLDNLKTGYGGTRGEMERLLADAEKLTGVKYDINNLGDVYDAIHVIQEDLGLTGVAAAEASETLSGSFGAMKAAAQNFLGSLALGENVSESLGTLLTSASTFFFGNLLPMVGTFVKALPPAIVTFAKQGLPILVSGLTSLITSLVGQLTTSANGVTSAKVQQWATTTLPKIVAAATKLIGQFASTLLSNLPKVIAALAKIGAAVVTGLGSALWGKVTAAANGIKDRFLAPINAMKDKIKAVLDKIKNMFPLKLGNLFKVKLPTFKIISAGKFPYGVAGKGSLPKWDVVWNAKGGIFDTETVLPGIGLGEAGPEAILPLTPFWERMDKIAENAKGGGNVTVNVYASPGMNVNELAAEVERRIINTQKRRNLAWL